MKDNSNSQQQPNSLEQLLLSAARREEPSPELERRMLAPLFAVPTLPPPLGAPEAGIATTSSKAAGFTWVALTAGGLSLAGTVAWLVFSAQAPGAPSPSPVAVSSTAQTQAPSPLVEGASVADVELLHPSPQSDAALPTETAPPPKLRTQAPSPKEHSTLNEEMRLLDQAREALAQGDQQRALAILSRYERKYPRGVLKPEATVLRVSALSAAGQAEQADDLKKDFLDQHPTSAHRQRLENDVESTRRPEN